MNRDGFPPLFRSCLLSQGLYDEKRFVVTESVSRNRFHRLFFSILDDSDQQLGEKSIHIRRPRFNKPRSMDQYSNIAKRL